MIKGDKTICGTPIVDLTMKSHKKVCRICDFCGDEAITAYRTLCSSRRRRNENKDICRKCGFDESVANRRKHSRFLSGYACDSNKKFVHITEMEKFLNRPLEKYERVHHINENKSDNRIENLFLCKNDSQHKKIHNQLEKVAVELYNLGLIKFDKNNGFYFIDHEIKTTLFPTSLGFENVAIKQKKNLLKSRLDADIKSEVIRGIFLNIPLIAANMSTVVNSSFCIELESNGALGIMHRALASENYLKEVEIIADFCKNVAVSIGVTDDQFDLAKQLVDKGANIIVIDIAHGYSDSILEFGKRIKKEFPVKLVLGNTTNIEMLKEAADFADAIKVGIAQGFACETKNTAGCTEKQFSAVLKFKEFSKHYGIPIISDGGIREPADFTKAIAAGANSVMAGKLFAECRESAAEIVYVNGVEKKLYAGMASQYVQNSWRGGLKPGTCAEGGIRYLDIVGSLSDMLERYSGALRSGITYGGGVNVKTFQDNVEFVRI